MSGAPERIVLAQIAPQPWKNGCGVTREIAVDGPDAGWRLSVADVDRAVPFSAFPGIDRVIVLLEGAGIRLRGERVHDLVEPGVPFAFPGEAAMSGEPIGGPTRDLNVMTRRGRWRSELRLHRAAALVDGADALAIVGLRGRFGEPGLAAGEVLLWRERAPGCRLVPAGGDAAAIAVRLIR